MKVVKRDGRVVDYNRNKILIAVRKANAEVDPFERVSEDDIDGIIASVEGVNRETIQVEDIQDMIEQKLMAAGKFIWRRLILFTVIPVNWFVKQIQQTIRS